MSPVDPPHWVESGSRLISAFRSALFREMSEQPIRRGCKIQIPANIVETVSQRSVATGHWRLLQNLKKTVRTGLPSPSGARRHTVEVSNSECLRQVTCDGSLTRRHRILGEC